MKYYFIITLLLILCIFLYQKNNKKEKFSNTTADNIVQKISGLKKSQIPFFSNNKNFQILNENTNFYNQQYGQNLWEKR